MALLLVAACARVTKDSVGEEEVEEDYNGFLSLGGGKR